MVKRDLPRGPAAQHLPHGSGKSKTRNGRILTALPVLPICVGAFFRGGGKKETCWNCVSRPAFRMRCFGTSDTSGFCDSPKAAKQEQHLPTAAPDLQRCQRAFRSSGEKHHRNTQCYSHQQEAGARAPGAGTGLTHPALQLAQYATSAPPRRPQTNSRPAFPAGNPGALSLPLNCVTP